MKDLRSPETYWRYISFIKQGGNSNGCNLCKPFPLIEEFNHWRILNNEFPYDAVAKTTHLLLPKRHVAYQELNVEEREEYDLIRSTYIEEHYHITVETPVKRQSIPKHFHVCLLVFKDD